MISFLFWLFREIWVIDFEFYAPDGERPKPLCMVARELRSERRLRVWGDQLKLPPFDLGPDVLFVAYYASAEIGCFIELGWPTPARVLDLFVEFRNITNGLTTPCGSGLLGAMSFFGLDSIEFAEKNSMRELAMRGGEYTESERLALIDYCEADVDAVAALLRSMSPNIDLARALIRGRYMSAAARMEATGIPIDVEYMRRLQTSWDSIKDRLIDAVDADYGVYVVANGSPQKSFSSNRFAEWLTRKNIPWPHLESGNLDLSDDCFREMSKKYSSVAPLRELRYSLSKMRLNDLAVGSDDRNRTLLSAFRAVTGRNQPSNAKFIFGPSCWLRGLIKPPKGWAIAYIDWSAQEIGIAAKLSGDVNMQDAYLSGDPYLWLGKMSGVIPSDATKKTHPELRDVFKVVYLAANYGMGERSLAQLIGQTEAHARELLRMHRERFPTFWAWSDSAVDHAMLKGWLTTVFGWELHVRPDTKPTSLRNFPVQANGAEMLRLACCLATERGIRVCAPVHDALLVEGADAEIDDDVRATQAAMQEASATVLDGFVLRTDVKVIRYPDRYMDPRGEKMWNLVGQLLNECDPS